MDIECKKDIVKFQHNVTNACLGTIRAALQVVFTDNSSSWARYFLMAKKTLGLPADLLTDIPLTKLSLKNLLKKCGKNISRQQDLERIRPVRGAEGLINSYETTACQPYLKAGLGREALQNVMRVRLLTLPIQDYRADWKNWSLSGTGCCLCQYHTESAEHVICCCPALLTPRRLHLRTMA